MNFSMYHVLLFYKIIKLKNPEAMVKRHKEVCKALQIKGRVLVGHDGVNGIVGGSKEQVDMYRAYMDQHKYFCEIDFKESTSEFLPFPKMKVKFRKEIITTETRETFSLDRRGNHITRDKFHEWLVAGEDVVLVDMRNDYEWEIGRFKGAERPEMKYFRELKDTMNMYEKYKDKKIVMYCTGGIRCEPASAFFLSQGFDKSQIYQLEGGIVKYVEKYGDQGFYEGKVFMFDDRLAIPGDTSDSPTICGECLHCSGTCDTYRNCANRNCNKLFLGCEGCVETFVNTCSEQCKAVVENPEEVRPDRLSYVKVVHRNK